ncbi:hypothetical protein Tco_0787821 [Tanacetum coccineum]
MNNKLISLQSPLPTCLQLDHHVNNLRQQQQKQSLVSLFHVHQRSFFTCLPFNNNNPTTLSSVSSSCSVLDNDDSSSLNLLSCSTDDDDVRIVAVVGEGAISPLKIASWTNVLLHTAERLKWVDENYEMLVFTDDVLESDAALQKELTSANILLIISVTKQESVEWIQRYSRNIPNIVCFDSSPVLQNKLGGSFVPTEVKGSSHSHTPIYNILVSPNGEFPNETEKQRLVSALDRCCIKEWELFDVDNSQCNDPPLGLPEGSRLHTTVMAKTEFDDI